MKVLDRYIADIQKLCLNHKVKTLYVFGSVLTDTFSKESDTDFIVDFNPINTTEYADNYFDLKFSLQNILNRPVDLLEEKAIKNPYFKQALDTKRHLLYGHTY